MNVEVVTALFDIGRETHGDGRTMNQYLEWFNETLKLNCNMSIYVEDKFYDFVNERRLKNNTKIFIQKLEEVPFFKWKNKIEEIINSNFFKSKMKDLNRIECKNSLYNVIQYSKFGWIKNAIKNNNLNSEYFFWMDAGCSRFFSGHDLGKPWPDTSKFQNQKFLIQGNVNSLKYFPIKNVENYIWDNNSAIVGTLFGGSPEIMFFVENKISEIFENEMIKKNCVNNEQFALFILYNQYPEIFDFRMNNSMQHLPLFKSIS